MINIDNEIKYIKDKVELAKKSKAKDLRLNQSDYSLVGKILSTLEGRIYNKDEQIKNLRNELIQTKRELKKREQNTSNSRFDGGSFGD